MGRSFKQTENGSRRFSEPLTLVGFQSRYISLVLRSPQGSLVFDQMGSSNDRNLQSFNIHDQLLSLSFVEIDAGNFSENIDSSRANAKLNHGSGFGKIFEGEVSNRCPEPLNSAPDTLSVVGATLDPQIDVASRARKPVRGNRIRPDEHELNFFFAKRGQYVAEVGVQQLALP